MRAVGALLALTFVLAVAAYSQNEGQKSSQASATATTGGSHSAPATAEAIEPLTPKPGPQSPPQSAPSAHDDGTLVATAVVRILAADSYSFEQIRGNLKQKIEGTNIWHIAVAVPGFDCSLLTFGPERRNKDFVGCSADVRADIGESTYQTIAKALTEQLRTIGYSCQSPAEEMGKPTADVEEITGPKTIHQLLCSRGVHESFVGLTIQRYIAPKEGFLVRLNVNSSPIPPDAVPAPNSRANLPQPTPESQPSLAVAQRKAPPSLNGNWSCDPSSYRCKQALVTILGDQFTASVDTGEYPDAKHRCNSPDHHCIWSLTGTVEATGIRGVATQFSVHGDPSNCDSPATTHSFDAKPSDDGQRITIRTELTYYSGIPGSASKGAGQKENLVCQDVRLDRVESVSMILRRSGQSELGVIPSK
jgi:hypothetical protein